MVQTIKKVRDGGAGAQSNQVAAWCVPYLIVPLTARARAAGSRALRHFHAPSLLSTVIMLHSSLHSYCCSRSGPRSW